MEGVNNQQVNNQVPSPVAQAPQTPPVVQEQVGSPAPKTDKKRLLLYVVLLGLILVVIVGAVVFYMLYQPKENNNVAVIPTPAQPVSTEEEEADEPEIAGVTDLDNLLVGLARADESLDKDLVKLEKDSNF